MRTSHRVALVFSALVFLAPPAAFAGEEPVRLPLAEKDIPAASTDWYGLYANGGKLGWFRMEFGRKDAAYVMSYTGHMDLKSMGQAVVMEISGNEEFDTAAPFAYRGGRSEMSGGGQSQMVELVRGKDGFAATVTAGGATHTPPVPEIDYTLADLLAQQIWVRRSPRKPGDKLSVRSFDIQDLRTDVTTATVAEVKETILDGIKGRYYELSMHSENDGDEGTLRIDAAGRMLSMVMGGMFEARLEPEELAKKIESGGDLFVLGVAKIDKPIGDAPTVKRLLVEAEGAGAQRIPAAPRQSVKRDEKSGVVTVAVGPAEGENPAVSEKDVADALAETAEFPIRLPAVVELSKKAVGDASTQREKVDRLVQFVSDYVEDALMPQGMSVSEIIAAKRGDCSEHALLFAALARAAGVPAREVGGFMYMGDEVKAFGGHAWNEVLLDGKWVPVDPTWNQTEADAGRITLDRKGSGMAFVMALGQVTFRLKEVEHVK